MKLLLSYFKKHFVSESWQSLYKIKCFLILTSHLVYMCMILANKYEKQ